MSGITSVKARILYNSRGAKTIEVDIEADGYLGRACAPSGASVGRHEAQSFPDGGPESALRMINENAAKFAGADPGDASSIHGILRGIDDTPDYTAIGGAAAFAITIAAADLASRSRSIPMYRLLSDASSFRLPFPLGNILGGGAHAGPGTPDIQEILVCPIGASSIDEALETNIAVHRQLGRMLRDKDPQFTNGRGDEGGWAPRLNNYDALEISAKACEALGFTLGQEVALGVDFASSTQWSDRDQAYVYDRAGFSNTPARQIEFASDIISRYKLIYAEDAVHEEAFEDMAELTAKFPDVLITGDDLTVTNKDILQKAIDARACNAAILKVNQAGSLHDALEFADTASQNNISLITSHRSGESTDSHIAHIGLATGSKMLKTGIVGGERVAKLNELLRVSEHDLICGMAEL